LDNQLHSCEVRKVEDDDDDDDDDDDIVEQAAPTATLSYGALRSGVLFLIGARNDSLLQNVQTVSGAHPVSYSMVTGVLSWG
jgi:hypothetical protein